jgi:hypothetical protein
MVAPTVGPRRTDSLRTYVRATRITGGLGVLVVSGAIAWDFTNDRFWSHHALLTSLVASFIVVAVTAAVLNEVLERRQRAWIAASCAWASCPARRARRSERLFHPAAHFVEVDPDRRERIPVKL